MNIEDIKVGKWYNVPFKVVEIKSGDIHMENGGIKAVCQPSELSEISARQNVRSEHSTVGTLSAAERLDRLWNGMWDVLFGEASLRYAADAFNAMQNHIKSITPDPENGIKNTETAPKYDPKRIFRKGDKVKAVLRHGRIPNDGVPKDVILEVIADERDGIVKVLHKMGVILEIFNVYALYLELVTPVEELEPYFIEESHDGATIVLTVRCVPNGEGIAFRYCPGWGGNVFHSEEQFRQHAEAERDRLNAEHRKENEND